MPEPNYARIAYEAYAAYHNSRGVHGTPCGEAAWDDLLTHEQAAWQAAIDAAFNAQIPGDAP